MRSAKNVVVVDPTVIGRRIGERCEDLGISPRRASIIAGLNPSYANDIQSGKSARPSLASLRRLAAALRCDVGVLTEADGPSAPAPATAVPLPNASFPATVPGVPFHVASRPGPDGFSALSPAEGTLPVLPPVEGAYAVLVPDDSMRPRYVAGEYVVALPGRPVSDGGYAVVRLVDGRAAVRRIEGIGSEVRLGTLDGRPSCAMPAERVLAVHRVWCSGAFGT